MTAVQSSFFVSVPQEKKQRRAKARKQARESLSVESALSELRAIRERLNQSIYKAKSEERPVIDSPADAAAIIAPLIENLENEVLYILALDRRNRVMQIIHLYTGSVSSSQIRIGEVFREAIRINASAIVVSHNHPSGDPTPSPDDVSVTRAMVQAGKLLDIEVLDHIVIGRGHWVSLKERGLGFS